MVKRFLNSVPNALRGISFTFKNEPNFKIEVFCSVFTIGLLFFLKGEQLDFILVLIAVAMVLIAELFNTAIEKMVDLIQPEKHYLAGKVKDVAAGFVLTAVFFAFFIGVLIFYPLVMKCFKC